MHSSCGGSRRREHASAGCRAKRKGCWGGACAVRRRGRGRRACGCARQRGAPCARRGCCCLRGRPAVSAPAPALRPVGRAHAHWASAPLLPRTCCLGESSPHASSPCLSTPTPSPAVRSLLPPAPPPPAPTLHPLCAHTHTHTHPSSRLFFARELPHPHLHSCARAGFLSVALP
jgi:hypothetical protein